MNSKNKYMEEFIEVKKILDASNVVFWLDAGTLLGVVRDGKIMPWDNDIDLSTLYKNHRKIKSLIPKFKKEGFRIYQKKDHKGRLVTFKLTKWDDFSIDLKLFQVKGDKAWCILWYDSHEDIFSTSFAKIGGNIRQFILNIYPKYTGSKLEKFLQTVFNSVYFGTSEPLKSDHMGKIALVVPMIYYKDFGTIEFNGATFRIPNKINKYLELKYGKDWKTPKKEWVYWKQDGFCDPDWDINQ